MHQIQDWLPIGSFQEVPKGLCWKRELLNEASQTPNSGFWIQNQIGFWSQQQKFRFCFRQTLLNYTQLISLGFPWISDSPWIWETFLEAIISHSLQPCSSVFTFTLHPDTSVFLVHILNNQPQSMGFIWLRRGFTPKWASFPTLLQWSDIFGLNYH